MSTRRSQQYRRKTPLGQETTGLNRQHLIGETMHLTGEAMETEIERNEIMIIVNMIREEAEEGTNRL